MIDPEASKVGFTLVQLVWHQSSLQPSDWDEDAPYEIPDEEAEKPDGWLDDEPDMIPDPGSSQLAVFTNFS